MTAGVFRRVALTLAAAAILTWLAKAAIAPGDPATPTDVPIHYRLLLAPGADPAAIRIDVERAERLEIDATGNLLIRVGNRIVHHARPSAYQEIDGVRHDVNARFEFAPNGELRVALAEFDRTRPLTITPLF